MNHRLPTLIARAATFAIVLSLAIALGADAQEQTINLNTATEEELQALTGVGPSRATAIVRAREEGWKCTGDPTTPDETADDYALQDIHGIGATTAAKMVDSGATCEGETVVIEKASTGRRKFGAPEKDDAQGGI